MKRYFKIWLLMTGNSIQSIIASRFGMAVFIFGKIFRFILYLGFIYFLFSGTKNIANYNQNETLLFFISFTFLIALGQMFFREVYRFRGRLISGEFDFDLLKPMNPLFKNLAGGFDFLDLLTMPIYLYFLIKIVSMSNINSINLFFYIVLLGNGFLIMLAIYILVMSFGIVTNELDNAIWVYRDLESMGRFPVDIYKEPLRQFLTFLIPIGIMFTLPVKALLGLVSWPAVIGAIIFAALLYYLSLWCWNFAVKKYSSASS